MKRGAATHLPPSKYPGHRRCPKCKRRFVRAKTHRKRGKVTKHCPYCGTLL